MNISDWKLINYFASASQFVALNFDSLTPNWEAFLFRGVFKTESVLNGAVRYGWVFPAETNWPGCYTEGKTS